MAWSLIHPGASAKLSSSGTHRAQIPRDGSQSGWFCHSVNWRSRRPWPVRRPESVARWSTQLRFFSLLRYSIALRYSHISGRTSVLVFWPVCFCLSLVVQGLWFWLPSSGTCSVLWRKPVSLYPRERLAAHCWHQLKSNSDHRFPSPIWYLRCILWCGSVQGVPS